MIRSVLSLSFIVLRQSIMLKDKVNKKDWEFFRKIKFLSKELMRTIETKSKLTIEALNNRPSKKN